jgi:hypothetical protein
MAGFAPAAVTCGNPLLTAPALAVLRGKDDQEEAASTWLLPRSRRTTARTIPRTLHGPDPPLFTLHHLQPGSVQASPHLPSTE